MCRRDNRRSKYERTNTNTKKKRYIIDTRHWAYAVKNIHRFENQLRADQHMHEKQNILHINYHSDIIAVDRVTSLNQINDFSQESPTFMENNSAACLSVTKNIL